MSQPPSEEPTLPRDPEVIRGLLDKLEAWTTLPGTLALHDPLYELHHVLTRTEGHKRDDAMAAGLTAIANAIQQYPDHPLAAELRSLIRLPTARAPTLEDLLAGLPHLPQRSDPVESLGLYLAEQDRIRAWLEQRIQETAAQQRHTLQVSNFLAGAAAMLLCWGLLGWAGALGLFKLPFPDLTPTPGPQGEAATAQGSPEAVSGY